MKPDEQVRIDLRVQSCIDYLQEALNLMYSKDEDMIAVAKGNIIRIKNSLTYLRDKEWKYRVALEEFIIKVNE